jgi:hypothetical protein
LTVAGRPAPFGTAFTSSGERRFSFVIIDEYPDSKATFMADKKGSST